MIYNLLRNALLAGLLHAGIGLVLNGGSEAASDAAGFAVAASSHASVFAAASPAACLIPPFTGAQP